MKRFTRIAYVKEDVKDLYIWHHQQPREKLQDVMRNHGMKNHYLHIHNNLIISVFDYTGDDFTKDMTAIADHPITQEWMKIMGQMLKPVESNKGDDFWVYTEEITHFN